MGSGVGIRDTFFQLSTCDDLISLAIQSWVHFRVSPPTLSQGGHSAWVSPWLEVSLKDCCQVVYRTSSQIFTVSKFTCSNKGQDYSITQVMLAVKRQCETICAGIVHTTAGMAVSDLFTWWVRNGQEYFPMPLGLFCFVFFFPRCGWKSQTMSWWEAGRAVTCQERGLSWGGWREVFRRWTMSKPIE